MLSNCGVLRCTKIWSHEGSFVDHSSSLFVYITIEVDRNSLLYKAIDVETGEGFDELDLSK